MYDAIPKAQRSIGIWRPFDVAFISACSIWLQLIICSSVTVEVRKANKLLSGDLQSPSMGSLKHWLPLNYKRYTKNVHSYTPNECDHFILFDLVNRLLLKSAYVAAPICSIFNWISSNCAAQISSLLRQDIKCRRSFWQTRLPCRILNFKRTSKRTNQIRFAFISHIYKMNVNCRPINLKPWAQEFIHIECDSTFENITCINVCISVAWVRSLDGQHMLAP